MELLLCLGLSAWYGQLSGAGLILALPLLVAYLGLATGVGFLLSVILIFSRDAEQLWLMMTRVLQRFA
jgi:ABC-type polysaccharide/polyol phosphate export permease